MRAEDIKRDLMNQGDKKRAKTLQSYFKTKKEKEIFLGVSVPQQRRIAKEYYEIDLKEVGKLLKSKIHEERFISLIILIDRYRKSKERKEVVDFYLDNLENVNNWDLVDISAYNILGDYLIDKDRDILFSLAQSNDLWKKRVSIVASLAFIKKDDFKTTLKISRMLLQEEHHLIRKAIGWMLREVGKRSKQDLKNFIKNNINDISSITLSYATEKLSKEEKLLLKNKKTKI